ncbi:hypothetical protein [Arthrobacter sp. E3]|uniref:hypothetical protein n=1 Tax=Arthrobacter sp. E3 TaxID=517402 RepID=UPI001FFD33E0|nr:hypothetical protein [Arthrobacter sp. E3]
MRPISGTDNETGAEAASTGPLAGAGGGCVMGAGDGAAVAAVVPAAVVEGAAPGGLAGAEELDDEETWLEMGGEAFA